MGIRTLIQLIYYIYNTSNKIPHFHGKWRKYLDNTTVFYANREWGGEGERNLYGERRGDRRVEEGRGGKASCHY